MSERFCIILIPELIRYSNHINQEKIAKKWITLEINLSIQTVRDIL